MTEHQTPPPVLRIDHGNPTPEEIAAVVAVLTAAGGGAEPPAPPRSTWAGRARRTWRTSTIPS